MIWPAVARLTVLFDERFYSDLTGTDSGMNGISQVIKFEIARFGF